MARSQQDRESATLLDRLALAFLSGLSGLVLAALLWGGAAIFAAQLGHGGLPPLWPVVTFAIVMALIGFVALENVVGELVGRLINAASRCLGWLAP